MIINAINYYISQKYTIAYFGKPDQNLVQNFDQFQKLVLTFGAYYCADLILG